jgi:hypothetical protein
VKVKNTAGLFTADIYFRQDYVRHHFYAPSRQILLRFSVRLLNFFWFNTPQLAAEYWGCGGFVPPHTQRFQGEIFNTPELCSGDSLFRHRTDRKSIMPSQIGGIFYSAIPNLRTHAVTSRFGVVTLALSFL